MEWLEVTIKTVSSVIDRLADALTAAGYDSFIIDDSADFQSFLSENTQYWDYVDEALSEKMRNVSQIRLYFENSRAVMQLESLKNVLSAFRACNAGTDVGSLTISTENVSEEDWENNWKQYYVPIPVGTRLLIVPQWLSAENTDGRIPVILDPGMIFGTGAHASTQMCLKALERHIKDGDHVIDLGSGSGILSIAALLLGAKQATGVDIDPKAEDIARQNASLNDLHSPRFCAVTGNVIGDHDLMRRLSQASYDIVLANIVADVIIPLAPIVPHFMKKSSAFICSGILNTRLSDVISALNSAGLQVVEQQEQDDWCCLTAALK